MICTCLNSCTSAVVRRKLTFWLKSGPKSLNVTCRRVWTFDTNILQDKLLDAPGGRRQHLPWSPGCAPRPSESGWRWSTCQASLTFGNSAPFKKWIYTKKLICSLGCVDNKSQRRVENGLVLWGLWAVLEVMRRNKHLVVDWIIISGIFWTHTPYLANSTDALGSFSRGTAAGAIAVVVFFAGALTIARCCRGGSGGDRGRGAECILKTRTTTKTFHFVGSRCCQCVSHPLNWILVI